MILRLDDWEAEKHILTAGWSWWGMVPVEMASTPGDAACTCPHRRSQWSRTPSLEMSFRDQLKTKAVVSWTIGMYWMTLDDLRWYNRKMTLAYLSWLAACQYYQRGNRNSRNLTQSDLVPSCSIHLCHFSFPPLEDKKVQRQASEPSVVPSWRPFPCQWLGPADPQQPVLMARKINLRWERVVKWCQIYFTHISQQSILVTPLQLSSNHPLPWRPPWPCRWQ